MAFNRSLRLFTLTAALLLVSWMFIRSAQGQVTFSRDWNPGKRNAEPVSDLHSVIKSSNAICHLLINQIRQMITCDTPRDDIEVASIPMFNGRR
ncbi:uncharacterized protein LOC109594864 [Aethina tumida]|uniref:uncharacterized protein LOC109594864 n=1 Tax=Aethina tumida TaxID=116153 RepID=UPI00096AFFE3|nr:uncharacterized protein LOC109594864 [Aethina tumida]